ncbi:hypothetical protein AMAG_12609 [Allomyces macrogynus ATCC 38327]|uniref:CCDC43 PWI-like domain-containing protein n=1 Tax=Allomyces macrogynus (strain ATCC 38327) TaxID=578462 RepID=A0A0L0SZH1_ALLM3|nr:hypothetical protein AMAG_12609 [Allomyces macrogynus ATCC 38327]|eukprot:KNE67891.1 hypothetical protein AMAG_12609 [Allomyces macrogynus ATCC 38327]
MTMNDDSTQSQVELAAWLTTELATLGVEDEALVEYTLGILREDSIPDEDKAEGIVDFLATSYEDVPAASFQDLVERALVKHLDLVQQEADAAAARAAEQLAAAAAVAEPTATPSSASASTANKKKLLTRDEKRRRQALLAQYGFQTDEIVINAQGEEEVRYRDHSAGAKRADDGLDSNTNAKRIADQEAARRARMREEHEKKVAQDKAALEKQRLDKEKAKQRTQKKEKRRM